MRYAHPVSNPVHFPLYTTTDSGTETAGERIQLCGTADSMNDDEPVLKEIL